MASKDVDQELLDKFSKAKGKTLYELKELDDEEMDQLEDILIKPMLLITSIDSMDPNSKEYQEQFGSLPAGMSPYDAIGMMPQDQKDKIFEKIDQQMETMGESTLKIAAGNGVKAEYEKLGCDVDQVPVSYTHLVMRDLSKVKSLIIKIGSSSLCDDKGNINKEKILNLIWQIAQIKRKGIKIRCV